MFDLCVCLSYLMFAQHDPTDPTKVRTSMRSHQVPSSAAGDRASYRSTAVPFKKLSSSCTEVVLAALGRQGRVFYSRDSHQFVESRPYVQHAANEMTIYCTSGVRLTSRSTTCRYLGTMRLVRKGSLACLNIFLANNLHDLTVMSSCLAAPACDGHLATLFGKLLSLQIQNTTQLIPLFHRHPPDNNNDSNNENNKSQKHKRRASLNALPDRLRYVLISLHC